MDYHNLTDKDLIIIHNRSQNRYKEISKIFSDIKHKREEMIRTPIKSGSAYYFPPSTHEQHKDDELDVHNYDESILKCIATQQIFTEYVSEKFPDSQ
jgi:ABC-type enterochelin transport system substrate-binding protein